MAPCGRFAPPSANGADRGSRLRRGVPGLVLALVAASGRGLALVDSSQPGRLARPGRASPRARRAGAGAPRAGEVLGHDPGAWRQGSTRWSPQLRCRRGAAECAAPLLRRGGPAGGERAARPVEGRRLGRRAGRPRSGRGERRPAGPGPRRAEKARLSPRFTPGRPDPGQHVLTFHVELAVAEARRSTWTMRRGLAASAPRAPGPVLEAGGQAAVTDVAARRGRVVPSPHASSPWPTRRAAWARPPRP